MKKLIIICEGQTEQLFCEGILKPHLHNHGRDVEHPLILHSNGGIVPWRHLKRQIELHHQADPAAFITTFIDYYGLMETFLFPDWAAASAEANMPSRMRVLERGMERDVAATVGTQFKGYIQLHEFEALVLSDETAFTTHYEPAEYDAAKIAALCALRPETINDGPTTAPSKRLADAIPKYDKVNDGFELAALMGIDRIMSRCPRFAHWVTDLEML